MILRWMQAAPRAPEGVEGGSGGGEGGQPAPTASVLNDGGAGGQGAPAADPRAWLPEEYRTDPAFKDLADVNALAKSYRHTVSMVGADRAQLLKLPKDAEAPEWNDVYARLGRPEKPEGYSFKAEGLPEQAVGQFREVAHKLGISDRQAAGLMEFYSGLEANGRQAMEGQLSEIVNTTKAALKEQWGAAYADRVQMIEAFARKNEGEGAIGAIDGLVKTGNIAALNLLASAAAALAEPGGLKGGNGGSMALTPSAAQQEIERLKGDREFFQNLSDPSKPGNAEARRRWNELHSFAYPSAAA